MALVDIVIPINLRNKQRTMMAGIDQSPSARSPLATTLPLARPREKVHTSSKSRAIVLSSRGAL